MRKSVRSLLPLLLCLVGNQALPAEIDQLEKSFANPPDSARPWTWWHWNNGNISKSGIKADLQAMKDAGIAGAQIFDVGIGSPQGKVDFFSPEWFSCFRFALEEAQRLGLEIGVHNCPGWSSSGGPWIKPADSMKVVVFSETKAKGPGHFSGVLPEPPKKADFYKDIAVFAIPAKGGRLKPERVECTLKDPFDQDALQSDVKGFSLKFPQGSENFIVFDFGKPVEPKTLFLRFAMSNVHFKGEILASEDGKTYRSLRNFELFNHVDSGSLKSYSLASPAARFFKIAMRPQIARAFPNIKETGIAALWLGTDERVENADAKSGAGGSYNFPQKPGASIADVPPSSIDLSSKMNPDGKLDWEVPAGEWTILRMGFSSTGRGPSPARASGRGLECDKLDAKAFELHWKGMIEPLLKEAKGLDSFSNVLIDSYEVGGQNWTPGIVERFEKSKGYDPRPYLPILAGFAVVPPELAERFLHDWRENASGMMVENYFGSFAKLCAENGLLSSLEPYHGHFDFVAAGVKAAIPMGEFWGGGGASTSGSCRLAASCAHVGGHEIVAAEAFTVDDTALEGGWRESPETCKLYGDRQFCAGVNRLVLHSVIHQPFGPEGAPGLTLERFGSHFGRHQTWWPMAKAWTDYVARCQLLLRQGLFVADVCVFPGENAPNKTLAKEIKSAGFDYDVIDKASLLEKLSVKDGRLALPSGMSYALLSVEDSSVMSPPLLKKLESLLLEGAVVRATKPLRTPGLSGYPASEREMLALATKLWGEKPESEGDLKIGRGRLLWGLSAAEALAKTGLQPDFAAKDGFDWSHRHTPDAEIYFVCNTSEAPASAGALFRVAGRDAELWNPLDGETEACAIVAKEGARTRIPLTLKPRESVFVVFKDAAKKSVERASSFAFKPETEKKEKAAALEIVKAFYGSADGKAGADVLARVKGLKILTASNAELGGDPLPGVAKVLAVEYILDGKPGKLRIPEGRSLSLIPDASAENAGACRIVPGADGAPLAEFAKNGTASVSYPSGRVLKATRSDVPAPLEIKGPWTLKFQPGRGAPASIELPKLISLKDAREAGVKGFAGIMEYETEFEVPEELVKDPASRFVLSLGRLGESGVAEVELNGSSLGTLWIQPYELALEKALKAGRNALRVKVSTPWANRLIADASLPEDCDRSGPHLKNYPEWLLKGEPRTSGRVAFVAYQYFKKDSKPLDSGLLGPVALKTLKLSTLK